MSGPPLCIIEHTEIEEKLSLVTGFVNQRRETGLIPGIYSNKTQAHIAHVIILTLSGYFSRQGGKICRLFLPYFSISIEKIGFFLNGTPLAVQFAKGILINRHPRIAFKRKRI
jgi:hypothetical protein